MERLQGGVDRLHRGGKGLMPLQGDPDVVGAEPLEVAELAASAAQNQRDADRLGDRLDVGALGGPARNIASTPAAS